MKFYTSDLHLGCPSGLKFDKSNRFSSNEERTETILDNMFNIPNCSDLYILGDLAQDLEHLQMIFTRKPKRLYLHIITGNHDKKFQHLWKYPEVTSVNQSLIVKDMKQKFFLFHYPCLVWDYSHCNSINLFGHCHLNTPTPVYSGRQVNVNLEFWDYKPVSSETIIEKLDGVDNWDYLEVKRRRDENNRN